jgi:hypothetical protein
LEEADQVRRSRLELIAATASLPGFKVVELATNANNIEVTKKRFTSPPKNPLLKKPTS